MPLVDSQTGKIVKDPTAEGLINSAKLARAYALISIYAAASGHPGGTLSIMDLSHALYQKVMKHDPSNPGWEERDRCFWSAGHKAPALYTNLALSGYNIFPKYENPLDALMTLRKLYSPLQGHPDWKKMKGPEFSSGSLGQGLSVAVGDALAARQKKKNYHVYCIMGDGEQQEGQIWEAAMAAGHYHLGNLTAIIDVNRLQIDGWVKEVMEVQPLAEKYHSFGWHTLIIDGHNMGEILRAFSEAKNTRGKPTVILANTIKGKGVSYMEDKAEWHGVAPAKREQLDQALSDLKVGEQLPLEEVERLLKVAEDYQKEAEQKLLAKIPCFPSGRKYFWNPASGKQYYLFSHSNLMKAEMEPTRMGFGRALNICGEDPRVMCLGADISGSIKISDFYKNCPERKDRFISVGIAEANGMNIAAGLAKEGLIPVFGTYGVFSVGRALDQFRTTVAYGHLNVLVSSAHAGVSVGPDGATHQALEDMSIVASIPEAVLVVPADSLEAEKATTTLLFDVQGAKVVRFAREATPLISTKNTPFVLGVANVLRYRGEKENFLDGFETKLITDYSSEGEDLTIIANGPMVPEAMRAAYILKKEYGIETRIINLHSVKVPQNLREERNLPFSKIDKEAILRAAKETKGMLTLEEHQVGGVGNFVAAAVLEAGINLLFKRIGVEDRFGESGDPWELTYEFGLAAEFVAQAGKELLS